jgi:hypothetical protein
MMSAIYRKRFTILLGTLLVMMLIVPVILEAVAETAPTVLPLLFFLLALFLYTASIFAVSGRRGVLLFGLFMVVPVVVLDLVSDFLWSGHLFTIRHGTRAFFVGFVIVALVWHLFRPRRITFDTISASLCVYLLLGILWANVYTMIEMAAPGSFLDIGRPDDLPTSVAGLEARSIRMLYFSFVTLSTVGYGDIVPRATLARMCAVMEAIMGQGYLLVMVSRLVAIQVTQTTPPVTTPNATQETRHEDSADGH